jgi:hypothetical protein
MTPPKSPAGESAFVRLSPEVRRATRDLENALKGKEVRAAHVALDKGAKPALCLLPQNPNGRWAENAFSAALVMNDLPLMERLFQSKASWEKHNSQLARYKDVHFFRRAMGMDWPGLPALLVRYNKSKKTTDWWPEVLGLGHEGALEMVQAFDERFSLPRNAPVSTRWSNSDMRRQVPLALTRRRDVFDWLVDTGAKVDHLLESGPSGPNGCVFHALVNVNADRFHDHKQYFPPHLEHIVEKGLSLGQHVNEDHVRHLLSLAERGYLGASFQMTDMQTLHRISRHCPQWSWTAELEPDSPLLTPMQLLDIEADRAGLEGLLRESAVSPPRKKTL